VLRPVSLLHIDVGSIYVKDGRYFSRISLQSSIETDAGGEPIGQHAFKHDIDDLVVLMGIDVNVVNLFTDDLKRRVASMPLEMQALVLQRLSEMSPGNPPRT